MNEKGVWYTTSDHTPLSFMPLYLEHYLAAKDILATPEFDDQTILLHDTSSHNSQIDGRYTDAIVNDLVGDKSKFSPYDYLAKVLKKGTTTTNSRYTPIKFSIIRDKFMYSLEQKIQDARVEEANYKARYKVPVEELVKFPLIIGNTYVLVSYNDNYADEFDIEGFRVFWFRDWDEFVARLPEEFTMGIGTNEQIEYDSKETLMKCFSVKKINSDHAAVLAEHFTRIDTQSLDWNGRSFNKTIRIEKVEHGFFPNPREEAE